MNAAAWSLYLTALALTGLVATTVISRASVTAPHAFPDIRASADPELVERGRYLVYGPAHCASCHGDPARERDLREGVDAPLSGGRAFILGMLGTIVAPNITSDAAFGIGEVSDHALVRSLRYGISRHGKPLVPIMSFADLADDDLRAILSYLRTVPAVARPASPHRLSVPGTLAVNLLLKAQGPSAPPPSRAAPARTVEYGRYVAHTLANCVGCHTQRNKLTGGFAGPAFAGGLVLEEAAGTFVTPNLTPTRTGIMNGLSEQGFIARFLETGRLYPGSPMPWEAYGRMTETDLSAIYRYLRTLEPAEEP
ncbi:MAG TPA: hypothetical protein VKF40_14525 [Burkholderiales bacterium]|nr:hypothetical protein [Burkholderiales bacterium]